MKGKLTVVLLTVALSSVVAWSANGQKYKERISYEYNVITDPTASEGKDDGLTKLNHLGSQGWEITGVVQQGNNPPTIYLKRVRRF